jgi:hypothetical protein
LNNEVKMMFKKLRYLLLTLILLACWSGTMALAAETAAGPAGAGQPAATAADPAAATTANSATDKNDAADKTTADKDAAAKEAATVPSPTDKNSNWVPLAMVGANKLEGTTLQQLIWFIDKTTLKSSLDDEIRNKNGYEATVKVRTVAYMKNGEVSLLNEKWYIHTGGQEKGLFRGITERETIYQGKAEKLHDVAVAKVTSGSQEETVAQLILLYDTQRSAKAEAAKNEAVKAKP